MSSCTLMALLLVAFSSQAGTLTFTRPAPWTDRAPASSMRVAEFVVPRATGDTEDGQLIVYYFGGTGGSVEANLQRWTSQFQSSKADPDDVDRQRTTIGNISAVWKFTYRPFSVPARPFPLRQKPVLVGTGQ